jgi:hypothetical protein
MALLQFCQKGMIQKETTEVAAPPNTDFDFDRDLAPLPELYEKAVVFLLPPPQTQTFDLRPVEKFVTNGEAPVSSIIRD